MNKKDLEAAKAYHLAKAYEHAELAILAKTNASEDFHNEQSNYHFGKANEINEKLKAL